VASRQHLFKLDQTLDPANNSFNALRLVFAATVLVSHTLALGGFASEGVLGRTTIGTLAVEGFFALSGYLITASALRNHVGKFLWLRTVRIVPGFWVCLVLTAFGFAFVGWHHLSKSVKSDCVLSCYFAADPSPVGYVFHNALLKIHQPSIGDSLSTSTAMWGWNGSLWTIYFEVLCYLIVAALSLAGILRKRHIVLVLASLVWVGVFVITAVPQFNRHFTAIEHANVLQMAQVFPVFLAGSLLYLYREVVVDSGWMALMCVALFTGGFFLPLGAHSTIFTLSSVAITAPLLAYPLLWLGGHLPLSRVGKTDDYSYGVYLYAFPIQQLLLDFDVQHRGLAAYLGLTVLLTAVMALASWWIVERNALALRKWSLPSKFLAR
jgi:peptidoglycan/LPS O-acetylase OafA/YrhL